MEALPTPENKKSFANWAYSKFIEKGKYNDVNNVVYNDLDGHFNLIKMDTADKKEIYRECCIEQLKNEMGISIDHFYQKNPSEEEITELIKLYINDSTPATRYRKDSAIKRSRQIALEAYFVALRFDDLTEIPFN